MECKPQKKIRSFNKDIYIVAQTAFAFESEKEKIMKSGFNFYLSKPITRQDMIVALNEFNGYQKNI